MSLQQDIRKSRDKMKRGKISKESFLDKWKMSPSKIKKSPKKVKRKK